MKNPLSHSERRGGEHSLLYSFSCAPAIITVCRPGSFSVKRAQPLLGVFKSCVSWLQKQEPLLLSGHHQTFKQNPFYLKSQGKCDYLQLPGGTLIKTNTIIFSFTIFEQTGKWFLFMSSRKREKSHPVTSADNKLFKWQPIGGSSTALVWTHRKETKPFFLSAVFRIWTVKWTVHISRIYTLEWFEAEARHATARLEAAIVLLWLLWIINRQAQTVHPSVVIWHYTLPFASEFCLAFLIEEESWIAVSPAIPFHNLLPVEKQTLAEVRSMRIPYTEANVLMLLSSKCEGDSQHCPSGLTVVCAGRTSCWHFNSQTYSISLRGVPRLCFTVNKYGRVQTDPYNIPLGKRLCAVLCTL